MNLHFNHLRKPQHQQHIILNLKIFNCCGENENESIYFAELELYYWVRITLSFINVLSFTNFTAGTNLLIKN